MTKLEKAKALKCFGRLVETYELDPDPNTQSELRKEYNCFNCDSCGYCETLKKTLS